MDSRTKTPQGVRATDRVLDALLTLAELLDRTIHDVKSLDSDFQERLLQAVHETEESVCPICCLNHRYYLNRRYYEHG